MSSDDLLQLSRCFANIFPSPGACALRPLQNWIYQPRPLSVDDWVGHLAGTGPAVAAVPVEGELAHWGALDVDYDVDPLALLTGVADKQLPLLVCRSTNHLHLYLFLVRPLPAEQVREWLRNAAAELNLDPARVEVFPKQSRARPGSGSNLTMPYEHGTNRVGLVLRGRLVGDLTAAEFAVAAVNGRVEVLPPLARAPVASSGREQFAAVVVDFEHALLGGAPPCLRARAAAHVASGEGRNDVLFQYAVFARRAWGDDFERRVEEFNETFFDEVLDRGEVEGILRSVGTHDYAYLCPPAKRQFADVCNKQFCRTQCAYGIGLPPSSNFDFKIKRYVLRFGDEEMLTRVELYFASRPGVPFVVDNLLDLTRLKNVRVKVAATINVTVPAMQQAAWENILMLKLIEAEVLPAKPDPSYVAVVKDVLTGFVRSLRTSTDKRRIVETCAVVDEVYCYFRVLALEEYSRQLEKMGRLLLLTCLENLGAVPNRFETGHGSIIDAYRIERAAVGYTPPGTESRAVEVRDDGAVI